MVTDSLIPMKQFHHVTQIKYLFMQKLCCFYENLSKYSHYSSVGFCWRKRISRSRKLNNFFHLKPLGEVEKQNIKKWVEKEKWWKFFNLFEQLSVEFKFALLYCCAKAECNFEGK